MRMVQIPKWTAAYTGTYSSSFSAVRYGRVPKRSKSVDDPYGGSSDVYSDDPAAENRHLELYDIILNISQAHHAHCAVTEDKIKSMQRKHSTLVSSQTLHC